MSVTVRRRAGRGHRRRDEFAALPDGRAGLRRSPSRGGGRRRRARLPSSHEEPGAVKDLARRAQSVLRRQPTVADAALALVLAIAALVSVGRVRRRHPHRGPLLRSAGLARHRPGPCWGSRSRWRGAADSRSRWSSSSPPPSSSARASSRSRRRPSPYLAVSLAIYSAAVHGRRRFRTPVLTVCARRDRRRGRT